MPFSLLRPCLAFVLLVALLGATPSRRAYAQTITVTTTAESPGLTGDCTLGEAIDAANGNAAIDACLAGAGSDTISLQPGATYTLTLPTPIVDSIGPSAFHILSDITIQGNGATLSHDPAGNSLRFIRLNAGHNLTLIDLTLRNGRALGPDGDDAGNSSEEGEDGVAANGGAIRTLGGSLTLDGVHFIGNLALGGHGGNGFANPPGGTLAGWGGSAYGGALALSNTPLTILGAGATFSDNEAHGGSGGLHGDIQDHRGGGGGLAIGGAVYAATNSPISGVSLTMVNNRALAGSGQGGGGYAAGGGLATGSALSVTSVIFENNRARGGNVLRSHGPENASTGDGYGGALYISSQAVTLTHSRLYSNTAVGGNGPSGGDARGGGAYAINTDPLYRVSLQQSTLLSNTAQGGVGSEVDGSPGAGTGGGLFATNVNLHLESVAIVGNIVISGSNAASSDVPQSRGGGLGLVNANVFVTNTTLARNTASLGGGVYNNDFGPPNGVALTHVTVYSNTANQGGGLYGVINTTLRNSLVAHNSGGNCSSPPTLQGNNLQFPDATCGAAIQANPLLGTLADHGGGTLTVDLLDGSAAINLAHPAYCPPVDQRGVPRPVGAACDLGAFEFWRRLFLPLLWR
jgi:hypothetical protein